MAMSSIAYAANSGCAAGRQPAVTCCRPTRSSTSLGCGRRRYVAALAVQRKQAAGLRCASWRRPQQQQQQQPDLCYLPGFLHEDDFKILQTECRSLRPRLLPEQNTIACGRLGCYLPPSSSTATVLASREVADVLTQSLCSPARLYSSDFPMELRLYPQGSHMPWHTDEALYLVPQWELIYTLDNSSDSRTEWRDSEGKQHSQWLEPNSLLAVRAEGWEHRVTPVCKGERLIVKLIYTASSSKLPSFDANLSRVAYQR